jgi:hypothetical protein
MPTCDPLLQDCADGEGCYWVGTEFQCALTGNNVPEGEPCGFIGECAPGNACIDAESLPDCAGWGCCASWCDLGAPICDIAGTECVPWFAEGEAPAGLDHVGVCALPG